MQKPAALTFLFGSYLACLVYLLGVRLVPLRQIMSSAGERSIALYNASHWVESHMQIAIGFSLLATASFGWYASKNLRDLDRRRTYRWFGGLTGACVVTMIAIAIAIYLPIFRMATSIQN